VFFSIAFIELDNKSFLRRTAKFATYVKVTKKFYKTKIALT